MSLFTLFSNLAKGTTPGQIIIQLTDHCNAQCPQCAMRVENSFNRSVLPLNHCSEIIKKAAERGVAALSITGGEPLLFPREVSMLIRQAAKAGIVYTRTGTNGFLFRNPERPDFSDRVKRTVQLLAETPLRNFWISIDSADPDTHEQMRGFPGVIRGLEKALPIFHQNGLFPTANLGINRNLGGTAPNVFTQGRIPTTDGEKDLYLQEVATGLRKFFALVTNLGFTLVNFCYPMSISQDDTHLEAVYPANSSERIVRFSSLEKSLIFSAMLETIPVYRDTLRIFTPLSALHTMKQVTSGQPRKPFPCRGGRDHFFISAGNGHTYPCGYRGHEDLGDYRTVRPAVQDKAPCSRCDWECFRDPSELMGPLVQGIRNPLSLLTRFRRDGEFYRLWAQDLRYYAACDLFNGRSLHTRNRGKQTTLPSFQTKAYNPENTG